MFLPDIAAIIKTGGSHPWAYLPAAVVLGALHALEPGHSKSVMVAFIVAVRGTILQAVLLGLSAAFGHTLVIWILAALGLHFADANIVAQAEPWLVLASGLLILGLAIRLLKHVQEDHGHTHEAHSHDHDHHKHDHKHEHFGHSHMSDAEINTRYGARAVSSAEVIWFGFTGGLMPCPAAFAVLLICLQLKRAVLGFAMVGAFSAGLALTLVGIGVIAAWGTKRAASHFSSGYEVWANRLPYISGGIVMLLGLVITVRGLLATGLI